MMVQPPQANSHGNMTTMGTVDTSDLMMIIRWIIDISSGTPKRELVGSTHTTPHIAEKIGNVTERTSYILDTLWTKYTQQALTHASRIFHRMCSMQIICMMTIMRGGSMHKAEHDLHILMYPAYGTHHRGNKIQLTQNWVLVKIKNKRQDESEVTDQNRD